MVGQGRPIVWKSLVSRCAKWQFGRGRTGCILAASLLSIACLIGPSPVLAAEKTVRLRLAWGSGSAAKQRWTGEISIDGAVLTELQPLGIEPDAPVATRIDGSRLIVAPLVERGFDGCDVTVRADEQSLVRVHLRNDQSPQAAVFESSLAEVIASQMGRRLDELGSYFLARRSPGDQLRVVPTRKHMVFAPSETWSLKLQPDLAAALAGGPVLLDVQLRATGEEKASWRSSKQIRDATELESEIEFEIVCPPAEGAYRLTVAARPEEGFATRFVPGQQAKPIATRDVEFVVVDSAAKLPALVDRWLPLLTIDPANPRWWQRLPAWAQVPRLRDRSPGAVGNVRPVVRPMPTTELVELPPAPTGGDPYWQSYTLPVREPGEPHLVEIEYSQGVPQHLAIGLVEPDASGRVTATQQDASLFSEGSATASDGEVAVHRFVVWPRTRAPQLLIVNRHPTEPGQFGKIKLSKQDASLAALTETPAAVDAERLVAAYLAKPSLTENFGAAEWLDVESGLSVQNWSAFLDGARRLAQSARLGGYNTVMISVAADGSGLYPSRVANPSPRYDTGMLAASGQDPTRKDVLEMLLRVFDREQIRVIPTVQLAAPLPRLEVLRLGGDVHESGISCIGFDGRSWLAQNSTGDGLGPLYNPLNDRVQAELVELIKELTDRYSGHSSLAGIGVQVSGEGYGLLPGLAWGFDDRTIAQFSRATGTPIIGVGSDRFRQRANLLLGQDRQIWQQWRRDTLSQLYQRLAQQVTAERNDLRLILATENVFAGPELQQRVREAIAEPVDFREILLDHGLDLAQLNAEPAIEALLPHRLGATNNLQRQAVDLRVNTAVEQGEFVPTDELTGELLFHPASQFRLSSFDQRSPFGAEQTYLTVGSHPRAVGARQREQLTAALAASDAVTFVDGGLRLLPEVDPNKREFVRTLTQLPGRPVDERTTKQQPITMRVYRTPGATVVTLINEVPWSVQADVALSSSQPCEWQRLGGDPQSPTTLASAGTLQVNDSSWRVELQPHDVQAWRFEDAQLRVGEIKTSLSDLASQELERRIHEIESRAGNLSIQRSYEQLQNPGFELQDNGLRIVGWQPRQGAVGAIGLFDDQPRSGSLALRLKSEDPTGVAVQSHRFPAPDTGQLLVSVYLRFETLDEDAELRIAVQDQDDGRRYRQFAALGAEQLDGNGWSRYEFPLGDVPFGDDEQLRLHFHLTGNAEVFIDDVQLYDLYFDEARRRALVKRIYAAKIALEQGQVVDCLRVLDDYWSQYLVTYVPPVEPVAALASKESPVTLPEPEPAEEEKGIGSRLRGWVPSIWR